MKKENENIKVNDDKGREEDFIFNQPINAVY